MSSRRLLVVAVLLSVGAALGVAASGATGADVVTHDDTEVLDLEPHADAEGMYASVDDSGDVQIHADGTEAAEGLNHGTVADLGPVVTVENVLEQPDDPNAVWIAHDSDHITFYNAETGNSIEGDDDPDEPPADAVELSSGESVDIALSVDTRNTDTIDIGTFRVLTAVDNGVFTAGGDTGSSSSSTSATSTPDSTLEPESTPAPVEPPEPDGDVDGADDPDDSQTDGAEPTPEGAQDGEGPQAVEIAGFSLDILAPFVLLVVGTLLLVALLRRRRNE